MTAALATGPMLPTFAALGYSSPGSGEAPRGAYGADLPSRQQVVMT